MNDFKALLEEYGRNRDDGESGWMAKDAILAWVRKLCQPVTGPVGWVCPVCGCGLSPYTSYCPCKGWTEFKATGTGDPIPSPFATISSESMIYPNWYKINGRWWHCVTIYENGTWLLYVNGRPSMTKLCGATDGYCHLSAGHKGPHKCGMKRVL